MTDDFTLRLENAVGEYVTDNVRKASENKQKAENLVRLVQQTVAAARRALLGFDGFAIADAVLRTGKSGDFEVVTSLTRNQEPKRSEIVFRFVDGEVTVDGLDDAGNTALGAGISTSTSADVVNIRLSSVASVPETKLNDLVDPLQDFVVRFFTTP